MKALLRYGHEDCSCDPIRAACDIQVVEMLGAKETQNDEEEIDREQLTRVEAHGSWPNERKNGCEITCR